MAAPRLATIGVYGWTLPTFIEALHVHGIRLVVDIRQRRGVRGSEYAWANAQRLEEALAAARIDYRHAKELAPTTELRQLQYREDERMGVGKRSRETLAPEYRRRYVTEILDRVDPRDVVFDVPAALLCVERDPKACHRSLAAERLAETVVHLRPPRHST